MVSSDGSTILEFSKQCHNALIKAFAQGVKVGTAINENVWVPLAIASRILRSNRATAALVERGYPREAAILVLTEFELILDILYVCKGSGRATKWVDHKLTKQQVWEKEVFEKYDVAEKRAKPYLGGFGKASMSNFFLDSRTKDSR